MFFLYLVCDISNLQCSANDFKRPLCSGTVLNHHFMTWLQVMLTECVTWVRTSDIKQDHILNFTSAFKFKLLTSPLISNLQTTAIPLKNENACRLKTLQ